MMFRRWQACWSPGYHVAHSVPPPWSLRIPFLQRPASSLHIFFVKSKTKTWITLFVVFSRKKIPFFCVLPPFLFALLANIEHKREIKNNKGYRALGKRTVGGISEFLSS
jgi:hypothetical protein